MSTPPKLPQVDGGGSELLKVVPVAASTPKVTQPHQLLLALLNLCLWVFLADALFSLLDDSLIQFFDVHALSVIRFFVGVLCVLMSSLVYGLMGLTPLIPKRLFVPLTLYFPVSIMAVVPCVIYYSSWLQQIALVLSLGQVILALGLLYWLQSGLTMRWELVSMNWLGARRFSWLNLSGFLFVNVFVLLPAVVGYLILCAVLAVGHGSEGFVALHPEGMTVQARKYVRADGKTIQLIPMAHIGDAEFYQKLTESFPSNSIILMEGVTDNRNLLTNDVSYKRMAKTLGLTEQTMEFKPNHGEPVMADVDVEQFTKKTLDFLNLVMLFHSKGVNAQTLPMLLQYTPPPNILDLVMEDLVLKRNQHLLGEIQTRLAQSQYLIVPWGADHMPGIAEGIEKAGFHVVETKEYLIIRFGSHGKMGQNKQ